jgi:fumarate reductase iron-sulfur subunit
MAVTGAGGCQNCHTHQSCEQLCPNKISPTESIAGLKRRAMQAALKGELR